MIESRPYQICTNCVMDTTDPRIVFDNNGVCDHCNDFSTNIRPKWHPDAQSRQQLEAIVRSIQSAGRGKDFDCLLGLSGGIDSSYMLHLMVTELGLRPLVFHVDGGWNSELAVHNINVLIDKLGLDLYTEVINWGEMRDFQLAWFKSGVPHIDIPQDHAFIATLYNFAEKYHIRHILNGGNYATECVRYPIEYYYFGTDMIHIRDIMRRYGTVSMRTYPFSSIYRHKIYLRYVRQVKVIRPLNYLPYTKATAFRTLEREYGWKSYPQKHYESRFTRFFEGYWLPVRFGFDPRRVKFSSLILTGQMTREEASQELEKPPYDPETIGHDFDYVATKLGIPADELRGYLTMPKKFYWDYANQQGLLRIGAKAQAILGLGRSGMR